MAIALMTFASCNKDNELKDLTEGRTAIATRDVNGNIVNLLNVEEIQKSLDMEAVKGENEYVLETYSITEPTSEHPYFLTIKVIDVTNNEAHNISFVGEYVEEIANNFYITSDLKSGNTSMRTKEGSVLNVNNGIITIDDNPNPAMLPPAFFVDCFPQFCKTGCEPEARNGNYVCSDCEPKEGHETDHKCDAVPYTPSGLGSFVWRLIRTWF